MAPGQRLREAGGMRVKKFHVRARHELVIELTFAAEDIAPVSAGQPAGILGKFRAAVLRARVKSPRNLVVLSEDHIRLARLSALHINQVHLPEGIAVKPVEIAHDHA